MSADGTRTYAVSLHGTAILEGAGDGRRYGDVTSENDAAFEKRVQSVMRAVLRRDKMLAVRFIRYPLAVNFPDRTNRKLRNPAQVLAAWNEIFTPATMSCLQKALPHDMSVHEGMAMIGDGEVWFDAKGLVALNVPVR